jgi:hypothetical protein
VRTASRPFRALGIVFVAAACLLAALGAWSLGFVETTGRLIEIERSRMTTSGGYPGIPHVRGNANSVGTRSVRYRYRVGEARIEGSRIGMGLAPWTLSPIAPMRWEQNAESGESVTVYYAPALPSVSVLHRGLDVVCIFVLGFVGLSLIKLSKWLHRRGQDSEDGPAES